MITATWIIVSILVFIVVYSALMIGILIILRKTINWYHRKYGTVKIIDDEE